MPITTWEMTKVGQSKLNSRLRKGKEKGGNKSFNDRLIMIGCSNRKTKSKSLKRLSSPNCMILEMRRLTTKDLNFLQVNK